MLERDWFARDADVVAPELLNKVLSVAIGESTVAGRIVETEAYLPDDPASHTFNGPTERNRVMFGPAGHLYVYLSYGIHRCANVVTGDVGSGQAVLIRAVRPVAGIALMRARRDRPDRELCDGPGKLCQALGIDLVDDGIRPARCVAHLDRRRRHRTPGRTGRGRPGRHQQGRRRTAAVPGSRQLSASRSA